MSNHVKVRKGRDEQIYFAVNADKNADVQMVLSTTSLTLFIDFTLPEAKSMKSELDKAIKERERQLLRR